MKNLDLSTNEISSCFETQALGLNNLEVLDLSYNLGTDNILSCVLESSSLKVLYLRKNRVYATSYQGLFSMLINLEVLDMTMSEFSDDGIASALSSLRSLKSLNLEFCQLNSKSLHSLSKLRTLEILDLAMVELEESNLWSSEKEEFAWPTNLQFLGLSGNGLSKKVFSSLIGLPHLKSLDLSLNQLKGSLNISGLASSNLEILNFSQNHITDFVVNRESLNLSFNKLSGQIPPQLNELTFLSAFSVANNNLSGAIPERKGQFMTFEETCFRGNPLLCGPPLSRSCNPSPAIFPNESDSDGDSGSLVDMFVFCVTFAVSYA